MQLLSLYIRHSLHQEFSKTFFSPYLKFKRLISIIRIPYFRHSFLNLLLEFNISTTLSTIYLSFYLSIFSFYLFLINQCPYMIVRLYICSVCICVQRIESLLLACLIRARGVCISIIVYHSFLYLPTSTEYITHLWTQN